MTHSPEKLELVARALAESYFDGRRDPMNPLDIYDWASRDDLHKAGWKLSAAALLDALAPLYAADVAAAVRVKPLVWSNSDPDGIYHADHTFGWYEISPTNGSLLLSRDGVDAGFYDTVDAARAAAQADYEARILSAVEAVDVATAVAAETARCAKICETLGVLGGVTPNPYATWKTHADNLAAAIRGKTEGRG